MFTTEIDFLMWRFDSLKGKFYINFKRSFYLWSLKDLQSYCGNENPRMLFMCLPNILHLWVATDSFKIPWHDCWLALCSFMHIFQCVCERFSAETLHKIHNPTSWLQWPLMNPGNHLSRTLDPDSLLMTDVTWFPWPSKLWLFFALLSLYLGSLGRLARHWQLPCAWLTCLLNDYHLKWQR